MKLVLAIMPFVLIVVLMIYALGMYAVWYFLGFALSAWLGWGMAVLGGWANSLPKDKD